MEWIYYVAIFFWVVSAISKAKKKQQLEIEKKKQAFRPAGTSAIGAEAKPSYRKATEAEILNIFQERMVEARSIENPVLEQDDIDYDIVTTYDKSSRVSDDVAIREHSSASHFHLGKGMTTTLADMSNMPKGKEALKSVDFSVYTRKKTVAKQIIATTPDALKKYFIASEIFGKPKALRKS
jgi:hypothetical protein